MPVKPPRLLLELRLQSVGQDLGEHLHRRVGDGQQRAVALGEHVARLVVVRHRDRVALLGDPQVRVLGGSSTLWSMSSHSLRMMRLSIDEIEHIPAFGVERALDDTRAR